MRGYKKILLSWGLVAAFGPLSAQATERANLASAQLFPTASCNVIKAIPTLKTRLRDRDLNIEWDGDLPWPDVLGIWTNPLRDAYVVVGIKEFPNAPWGHANVTLRSICTDEVLAEGARIITGEDWQREFFYVRLRNYGLNGSRLIAQVRVNPETCALPSPHKKLEVYILQQTGSDENPKLFLRDSFEADRF